MLFPVGTREPVHRTPWVTHALVVVNLGIYFAFNVRVWHEQGPLSLDAFLRRWAYVPDQSSWTTMVTAMFLHADIFHVALNMWALALFGRIVEDRLGPLLYALLYFGSGVGASLLQDAFTVRAAERLIPQLGASGAICGVMGGLLVTAFWAEFRFFYLFWVFSFFRAGTVTLISLWVCLYYVGADLLFSILAASEGRGAVGGVAVFAHVGGFFTGLAIALLFHHGLLRWLRGGAAPRPLEDASSAARRSVLSPIRRLRGVDPERRAATAVLRLLHRGATLQAVDHYLKSLDQFPDLTLPPVQMNDLATLLASQRRDAEARGAFEKVLATAESGHERMRALLGLARLCLEDPRRRADGVRHLRELTALAPDPETLREANHLLKRLARRDEDQTPPEETVSPLSRELEARAHGLARPAYVPVPAAPEAPRPEPPPAPLWELRADLPPPRPAYIPDPLELRPAPRPTHAVVAVGHRRIEVPRVAQVIARVTRRAMVEVAGEINRGLGVLLETDSVAQAQEVARQLATQHFEVAVVDLGLLPEAWELRTVASAAILGHALHCAHGLAPSSDIPLRDILVIAHAAIPRMAGDPEPDLICDILVREPPQRLRASHRTFRHATAGADDTLRAFVLLLAERAAHAQRDAGLAQSLATGQSQCLRFSSLEQFERYQRWLALCALARL